MKTQPQARTIVIPRLPNELVIEVLSHLSHSSHLASAALVSRKFATLVRDLIYRSVDLNVRCSEEEAQGWKSKCGVLPAFERLSRLINHLSANHELG